MALDFPIRLAPPASLYRGDASGRNNVTITLVDDNDQPVDLTQFGDTWKSQAKGASSTIDLVVDDANASTGVLVVNVPDAASPTLPDSLPFDVQVTTGTDLPTTIFTGNFDVSGEVTT